jgi:hypothetical protein
VVRPVGERVVERRQRRLYAVAHHRRGPAKRK